MRASEREKMDELIAIVGPETEAARKIRAHYAAQFGLPEPQMVTLRALVSEFGVDGIRGGAGKDRQS